MNFNKAPGIVKLCKILKIAITEYNTSPTLVCTSMTILEKFRRIALESCPTVHLGGGPMTILGKYPAIRLEGLSNILSKLGSVFSRTNSFCFEN